MLSYAVSTRPEIDLDTIELARRGTCVMTRPVQRMPSPAS